MVEWRPSADEGAWHARATLLDLIRSFFKARSVLEVNTPLLTRSTVTDPHLHSFQINDSVAAAGGCLYLQTSPEYAMKRLLAAGSGPIYQICPAFRDEEHGIHHNPEFTLVEWYRPGYTLEDLMDEVDELLIQCLNSPPGKRLTYQQAFIQTIEMDPFSVEREILIRKASKLGLVDADQLDDDGILEFLFSHSVQPELGTGVCYVYHYPASQAALSRI